MPLVQRRLHRIAVSSFFFLAGICFASWASRIPDIQTNYISIVLLLVEFFFACQLDYSVPFLLLVFLLQNMEVGSL